MIVRNMKKKYKNGIQSITYNDNKINYLINLKNNIENLDKNYI